MQKRIGKSSYNRDEQKKNSQIAKADKIRALSLRYASGELGVVVEKAPPSPKPSKKGKRSQQERAEWREKYRAHIKSKQWIDFKAAIIAERGYRCQRCGDSQAVLDLHHKCYRNLGNEKPCDLCRSCHEKVHQKTITRNRATTQSSDASAFSWLPTHPAGYR